MLWPSPAWNDVTYWALDLETGGLDPARDPILAVGMVPIRAGVIRFGDRFETLVRPPASASITQDSVRAHQLVPGEVSGAPPLSDVVARIDGKLREDPGAALLVHQASLDIRFLRRAYKAASRSWPRPRVVDTVDLLVRAAKKARFIRPDAQYAEPVLNLTLARKRLGLPDYGAHDALTDAISTAELFLVLRKVLGARTLRDLS